MNDVLAFGTDAADLAVVLGFWLLMYAIGFATGYKLLTIRRLLDFGG